MPDEPKAPLLLTFKVPALMLVPPVKVLAPDKVSMPVPFLVRVAPVPVRRCEKVMLPAPENVTLPLKMER
ncbi:hypothetical protein LINBF2_13150 [Limnohabitans sp. INBF002]|nr:hypothetical protein LINBF2_13150 [Limnohabitans sp. INBF002]